MPLGTPARQYSAFNIQCTSSNSKLHDHPVRVCKCHRSPDSDDSKISFRGVRSASEIVTTSFRNISGPFNIHAGQDRNQATNAASRGGCGVMIELPKDGEGLGVIMCIKASTIREKNRAYSSRQTISPVSEHIPRRTATPRLPS